MWKLHVLQLKIQCSRLRCKLADKCLNVPELAEVVERNKDGPSLPSAVP